MSATTSLSELYVRLLSLARSIPRDPLRPSLQLSDTLEHAVHRAFGVDALAQSRRGGGNSIADSSKDAQANGVAGDAVPMNGLNGVQFGDEDFKIIQSAVDGLEAIKSDVAMRKVRTSDRTVTLPQHPSFKLTPYGISSSTHYLDAPSHQPRIRCTSLDWFKAWSFPLKEKRGAGGRGFSS
jgi:hypothetical protein